jgi:hypothetical protein
VKGAGHPGSDCTAGSPSPYSLERLSAFLDGDLPGAELQLVRAHVEACAVCAGRLAELRALAGAARGLDAPEPPPTLWSAIEGELDRSRRPWLTWAFWRPFGAGALAGAGVVAAVLFALGARPGAPAAPAPAPVVAVFPDAPDARRAVDPLLAEAEAEFARAAAVYERSIEKLRGLLAREESGWSPDMRARYAERLAHLDEAIARSRDLARRAAPGDSAGNEQLFAAYQQKIAFLTETVHRGAAWGRGEP